MYQHIPVVVHLMKHQLNNETPRVIQIINEVKKKKYKLNEKLDTLLAVTQTKCLRLNTEDKKEVIYMELILTIIQRYALRFNLMYVTKFYSKIYFRITNNVSMSPNILLYSHQYLTLKDSQRGFYQNNKIIGVC